MTIEELEKKVKEQDETIDRLMVMVENNARQKVDGLRWNISQAIAFTAKALNDDYSEYDTATQLEVYKTLALDLLDDLGHCKIEC